MGRERLPSHMLMVLQRVSHAQVEVDGIVRGSIGPGIMALVGLVEGDTDAELVWCCDKLLDLRIFEDAAGKMNLSLRDVTGSGVLLIPNFTLAGDARKGRRPSFDRAMKPERAEAMFGAFVQRVRASAGDAINVQMGVFRTHMRVSLLNDGPVTLIIDSAQR